MRLLDSWIGVDYTALAVGFIHWGRSSVGLERRPVTPEVAGSSPVAPAKIAAFYESSLQNVLGFVMPRKGIK